MSSGRSEVNVQNYTEFCHYLKWKEKSSVHWGTQRKIQGINMYLLIIIIIIIFDVDCL